METACAKGRHDGSEPAPLDGRWVLETKGEYNHRRRHSYNVSSLHSESTESKAGSQPVVCRQFIGDKLNIEVDVVHFKVGENVMDTLQRKKPSHCGTKQKGGQIQT